MPNILTPEQKTFFWEHGYVIAKRLFTTAEVELLHQAIAADPNIHQKAMQLKDSEGGTASLALWNEPGDDIFGALTRCERIVEGMEYLLDGEVYHYHSKITAKKPHSKGSWDWHQDYGYWYDNGILVPNLASVMTAIDKTDRQNGCLQVIDKSHTFGRIDHKMVGNQAGADFDRVEEILKRYDRVHVELEAGDAVFFHCNTLHRSDNNHSDRTRNVFISSYNRADNSSYREHQHPNYIPLNKLPDSSLLDIGLKGLGENRHYFPPLPNDEELKKA